MQNLFAWIGNLFSAWGHAVKRTNEWLLSKLYLLILPFGGVLKLVFDFCRSCVDSVVDWLNSMGPGFSNSQIQFPELVSFVNFWFPLDEIFIVASSLFTFFVGCQIVATIRGIKQTVLF